MNLEGQGIQLRFFSFFFFLSPLLSFSWAQDLAFSFLTLSTKPSLSLPTITLSPLHRLAPDAGRNLFTSESPPKLSLSSNDRP